MIPPADVPLASGLVCAACGSAVEIKPDVLEQTDGEIPAVTSSCRKCEWARTVRAPETAPATLPPAPRAG